MTTFLPALKSALDIPETPDIGRMRRETGARLRSAMADRGVDALILLGNNAVVYAAGVSWPVALVCWTFWKAISAWRETSSQTPSIGPAQ